MGIFIDFSKAFDKIKHSILLDKFRHYGIRGTALELFKDYLTNRKQYVFYDNQCYSDLCDVSIGVPQGSVLGPLFFIIYFNDIINSTDSSVRFILFADDTNVFITADTTEELYMKANKVLENVKKYIDYHNILLAFYHNILLAFYHNILLAFYHNIFLAFYHNILFAFYNNI